MTTFNLPLNLNKTLDVSVKRQDNSSFSTSLYRKKTFTELYTKWDLFTPRKYKINLIRTLTCRCLRICFSSCLLQSALNDLKNLLSRNGYPRRYYFLQHERCHHPEQTKRSYHYRTQKRCFHRFALSWTPE